ncbi:MAG: hypothetical protein QOD99_2079 [Chthoniobacter sp.]|jgi:hypothetical protein|nr:hypothetical protein [Chthoniobacter sp.]
MALEHAHIIDAIALDEKTGEVALIMIEPREWDGSERRLYALQEKGNAYLSFALDGEMAEEYPQFRGRPLRLQLECAHPPDALTATMITAMREQMAFQGIGFEVRIAPSGCGQSCGCAGGQ